MDASEDLRAQRFLRVTAVAVGSLAYWRLLFWVPSLQLGPLNAWLYLTTDPFPQAIFLIAAALAYRRRKSLRSAMRFRGSPLLAAVPLLAGWSLFVWGHYVGALDLVLVSFMLVSIGVGLLWFGARFARAWAVPLVVLAFALPAPAVVTNQIFYALRLWTAAHATALLQFVGIPAFQEGNVIHGSEVVAQVVDTCSGLRSMEMLLFAAIFYAAWFPARRLRQVLLVVLAPAIAYLFNLVRVGVMTLAPTYELSASHAMQGMTVFVGAILCLILIDRVLGRLLPGRPRGDRASRRSGAERGVQPEVEPEPGVRSAIESDRRPQPEVEPEASADAVPGGATRPRGCAGRLGAVSLAVLAPTMLAVSIWMPRWHPPKSERFTPAELPAELDGWTKAQALEVDRGFLWTVRYRKPQYWNYERNGENVSVFVGYDDRSNRSLSLLSRKNALPGRGWDVLERSAVALEPVEAPVERVVARSQFAQVLTYHWYQGTRGLASEILRALLAIDQSPFRRPQPARVIRVETALGSTPLERREAEANLRDVASSLATALGEGE